MRPWYCAAALSAIAGCQQLEALTQETAPASASQDAKGPAAPPPTPADDTGSPPKPAAPVPPPTVSFAKAEHGPTTFEKRYGGLWMDKPYAMAALGDGGYLLAGNSEKVDARYKGDYDVYVVRVGADGESIWSARAGALNQPDTAFGLVGTGDGGAIAVGMTDSKQDRRLYAARFDPKGAVLWERAYDDEGPAKAYAIAAMSKDRYVVTGGLSTDAGGLDLGVWSLGGDGALQRVTTMGGKGPDHGAAVLATPDGFVIAGVTGSSGAGKDDAWLMSFTGNALQWEKTYGGPQHDGAYALAPAVGGGFVLAGDSAGAGWVAWVDAAGTMLGEARVDTGGAFRAIALGDGSTVAAGWTKKSGLRDAWLVAFDEKRSVTTDRTFGYNRRVVTAATRTADGGVALAGDWASSNSNYSNFWLCKLDANNQGCKE